MFQKQKQRKRGTLRVMAYVLTIEKLNALRSLRSTLLYVRNLNVHLNDMIFVLCGGSSERGSPHRTLCRRSASFAGAHPYFVSQMEPVRLDTVIRVSGGASTPWVPDEADISEVAGTTFLCLRKNSNKLATFLGFGVANNLADCILIDHMT